MELHSGTYLQGDKYRIERTLGRGGFGVTYLAVHELLDCLVCIKEFFPKGFYNRDVNSCNLLLASQSNAESMEKYKQKFLKEAKTIARLKHPNIIRITDVFQENNTAYYVMEYVEGESLAEIVANEGAMHETRALRYVSTILKATEYIHKRNIAHLDIKPNNIMLDKDLDAPILIDFGLSKQYDDVGMQTSSTPVGISHGFAPIEQYNIGGVSTFSPTSDIYSIGATLYFLTIGKIPPIAGEVCENGIGELPSSLSVNTRNAIEKAMQYRRKDRPSSAREFLNMIEGATVHTNHNDSDNNHNVSPSQTTINLETLLERTYHIGDFYNENGKTGVVFEVSADGKHGKIIDLREELLMWCTDNQYDKGIFVGASSDSDGKSNTDNVMSRSDSREFPAFTWCRELGNEWYLPAKEELLTIVRNLDTINITLKANNSKELSYAYWSSTETSRDDKLAACIVHIDKWYSTRTMPLYYLVRAVSTF